MSNKYSQAKLNFLKNETWILSWSAASQRANIFPKKMTEKDRKEKRNEIKKTVFKIFKEFESVEIITEDLLVQKISYLVEKFNSKSLKFNVGHSQKLINILLKYYWCLGWIRNEPPHCPLDRIILSQALIKSEGKTPSWTKMDNIEDYKKYIKDIAKIADPKSIALWELETFNRKGRISE